MIDHYCETQVMIQLMSHDRDVDPYSLIGLAASTALTLSDIPFEGPISEVRVGRIDNQFVVNPSPENLEKSDVDLMIGASADSVVMVEGEMNEISEKVLIMVQKTIAFGCPKFAVIITLTVQQIDCHSPGWRRWCR